MLSFPSLLMCCQAHLLPPLSGINAPSYIGGVTPVRLPACPLRGSLHVVQDGSAFFPRACGLVRRGVLFSNGEGNRSDWPMQHIRFANAHLPAGFLPSGPFGGRWKGIAQSRASPNAPP